MQPISHFMSGRDNNFNLMRFSAACFIAYYHCYFMTLGHAFNDLKYPVEYELSQIVLNFFFVASGFLIARSFERRRELIPYIAARVLRLVPGIFVLSILLAFVMGPIVTEVSVTEYFSSVLTWVYVPLTTTLDPDRMLPGVFTSNINPIQIDEALWTLRYEVICYIGLAMLGLFGGLKRGRLFQIVMAATIALYLVITYLTDLRDISFINHIMHFGLSFFVGTIIYLYRDEIPLHWTIALGLVVLAGLSFMLPGNFEAEPLVIMATAYAVFWLAYIPGGFIRQYNSFGDYSYGIYIYHFPIEQVLVRYFGESFNVPGLFVVALPLAAICAVISWKYIEHPALAAVPNVSAWINTKLGHSAKS